MAKLLKLRRGTTSQHSSFTGAEGEVTVDTDKETLVVHNGAQAGGYPLARESDLTGKAGLTGATFTGNVVLDNDKEVRFSEADSNGAAYIGLKAPTDLGSVSSYTLTLPATAAATNKVLKTDSSNATQLVWADDSGLTLLDEDNFATDSATAAASQQSIKAYGAATYQPLDADLTSLAGCQSGAAGAIAALTQAEVEVLDGATVTTAELNILDGVTSTAAELNILDGVTSTTAELNTLDGFTGDKDDLIYAKDLKATGVTATEFDYLDGVTSNIQTQLNAKGAGDVTLAGAQSFTGVKTFNAAAVGEVTALTDASTVAVDFALSNNFSLLMTSGVGNTRQLGQPTNQVAGQSGSIFITQDGTGSRLLTYHGDWKWVGGSSNAPTLSTAAGAVDRIDYIVAAANKIHAVASLDVK